MEIEKYYQDEKHTTLYISDVRKNDKIGNCIEIIKHFYSGSNVFVQIYRVDGINLSNEEFTSYRESINQYFSNEFEIEKLINNKANDLLSNPLNIIMNPNKKPIFFEKLPIIFDYFLETTIFISELKWNDFKIKLISNSMNGLGYYVDNNFANIAFTYLDSGDFMISFDNSLYNPTNTIETIKKLLLD